MKTLKQLSALIALVMTLFVSSHGGEMGTPGIADPAPGSTTPSAVTAPAPGTIDPSTLALNLLLGVLSIY